MGIVNVTPDSFADGGRFASAEEAVVAAREMLADGAVIVDVGGESTRPGSAGVTLDEELRRVVPVLEGLAGEPVSVDTAKADVARHAVALGVELVNDVTALRGDPAMAGVVGKRKFLYDVWGDSVNVAARMESAGSAGRVNVSEAVHNRLKPLFDFESRGSVEAKGKGPLAMHYLVRIKPELSREGAGRVPNDAFHHECARLFPGYVP